MQSDHIFYLVHFDSFIESHRTFFEINNPKLISVTREFIYVQNIIRLLHKVENSYLVFIRNDNLRNQNNLLGLGENYLLNRDDKKTLTIIDDLYRDSTTSENPFNEEMRRFAFEYKKKSLQRFGDAKHYFAGNESHDCVPSIIQALVQGVGYGSMSMPSYEMNKITFDGEKINSFTTIIEATWPHSPVYFNNSKGMPSDVCVPRISLDSII